MTDAPAAAGEIAGYVVPFCAKPGDRVSVHVSTDAPEFEARLVRILAGDESEEGPGRRREPVPAVPDSICPGGVQTVRSGSFGVVDSVPAGAATLLLWAWPTRPAAGVPQAFAGRMTPGLDAGWAVGLDASGRLALWAGRPDGGPTVVTSEDAVHPRRWIGLVVAQDGKGEVRVSWEASGPPSRRGQLSIDSVRARAGSLTFAAAASGPDGRGQPEGSWLFDGKLAAPQLGKRALSPAEAAELLDAGPHARLAESDLRAAWGFERGLATLRAPDRLGGPPVVLENLPTRAVTGPRWAGDRDVASAPREYDAIHFHHDDVDDAGWEASLEIVLPPDLPSGIYGIELGTGDAEDCVPLFVQPPTGQAGSDVAMLFPTLSYLAYANERMQDDPRSVLSRPVYSDAGDHVLKRHPEYGGSVYDTHADGSGVCLSSAKRPVMNLRPGHRNWQTHAPRALSADLYVVDWLDRDGVPLDVITDHLLIEEGLELLRRYRVVITGSHPEYWSATMLDALEAWLAEGGRLMYLGGNGFYWVTAVHPERPHVVEVRRGIGGIRSWESPAGESRLQSTGEQGGLWRYRGRDPNRLVGTGFAAFGFDLRAPGFARREGADDPRASWIFAGVDADEIGSEGLILGGAAGDEVDRYDRRWGSPPHALVLASSELRHSAHVQLVVEDLLMTTAHSGGDVNPGARGDVVFMETGGGGAVFAASSMAWNGALAYAGFDNDVATITRNVLRRFRDPEPFPEAPTVPPLPLISEASSVGPYPGAPEAC